MGFLLDTPIVWDLIRHPRGKIFDGIKRVGEAEICTSIVVAAELRFGAARKNSPRLMTQFETILGAIEVLALEACLPDSPSKDCRSRAPNQSSSGNKVNLDTRKQQGKKKFEETMRATFRIFSFAFGEPCYALNLLSDRCLRTCGFPAHFSAVYARQFFTRPARIPLSFNLVRDRDCTEVDASLRMHAPGWQARAHLARQ